jgi:crossover junction endodeoxyribonuclease RuvC
MKILGIDPGIGRMGWAVIEENGQSFTVYGCDTTETSPKHAFADRLTQIYATTQQIIQTYQPHEVAVEELFFATNAKTAFAVGQARGVILLAAAQAQLSISAYTPLQVKLAVAGYGKADKKQVSDMVKLILKLKSLSKIDDTTDALAIALTHSFSRKMPQLRSYER